MKRYMKGTAALLTVALSLSLAACGGAEPEKKEGTGNSTEPQKKEKVTLQYWANDRHDTELIEKRVAEFNKENEGSIEVEMKVLAENYNQAVDIAFTSNQAPDIIRPAVSNFNSFVTKDYLAPLDDLLTDEMKTVFGSLLIEGLNKKDGKVYSLPNFAYTKRLIYNKDLFDKAGLPGPPTSYAELVDYAKKITEMGKKDGIYGFAAPLKNAKSGIDRAIIPMVDLSGHFGTGYNHKEGKYDFSNHKTAVEAWKQMWDDGSFLPGSEVLDIDPLRVQFAEGKIGMYMSVAAEVGVYKDQFPTEINWSGALVPTETGERAGTNAVGNTGSWLAISSSSKHKEEAWKFLQFMYDVNFLREYHESGFGISLVPAVLDGAKTPDVPHIEGFLPTKYDALWPVDPLISIEGALWEDEFMKYIMTGGDLDNLIGTLNTRYNDALDKLKASKPDEVRIDPDFDSAKLIGSISDN